MITLLFNNINYFLNKYLEMIFNLRKDFMKNKNLSNQQLGSAAGGVEI